MLNYSQDSFFITALEPGDLGDGLDGGSGFDYLLGNGAMIRLSVAQVMTCYMVVWVMMCTVSHKGMTEMSSCILNAAGVAGGDVLAYMRHGAYTTTQSPLNVMTMEHGNVIFGFGNGDRIAILSPGGLLSAGNIWMM